MSIHPSSRNQIKYVHWPLMVAMQTMKLSVRLCYHEYKHFLYIVTLNLKMKLYMNTNYIFKKISYWKHNKKKKKLIYSLMCNLMLL
jgi:hypothetical protein